jgi:RND family efflux transporter MFP subunit
MSRNAKILAAMLVVVAIGIGWRWLGRAHSEAESADPIKNAGVTVAVARVERRTLQDSLVVAGAFKAFQDVDVHAKVAGYIRTIYVDVGSRVKEGQILAVLEVPELAAQLSGARAAARRAEDEVRRAQGDLQRAKSIHTAAHAMYARLKQAAEQNAGLVAQQELDNEQAKDLEAEAGVSSAEAALSAAQQALEVADSNQKQFSALSDYTRITAPFAGVVTNRYADTGALVAAGTSTTQSTPVVRIAQTSVLRLVLPIPESIAGQIRLGDPVKVHVQALNQDSVGRVSRFADSLDQQTRTMETEIDFQNADGKLLPGMYVEAVLAPPGQKEMLTVRLEAVHTNGPEGTVLFVNKDNVLEERKVRLGIQGSTQIEVLSGLQEGDRVVVGNLNDFRSGMKVVPKELDGSKAGESGAK